VHNCHLYSPCRVKQKELQAKCGTNSPKTDVLNHLGICGIVAFSFIRIQYYVYMNYVQNEITSKHKTGLAH
jgi:hypothetical protein